MTVEKKPEVNKIIALELSESTIEHLSQIGSSTGIGFEDRLGRVIQDALRTYKWILHHQAHGRVIGVLEEQDLNSLNYEIAELGQNRDIEVLESFIPANKLEAAKEYFTKELKTS